MHKLICVLALGIASTHGIPVPSSSIIKKDVIKQEDGTESLVHRRLLAEKDEDKSRRLRGSITKDFDELVNTGLINDALKSSKILGSDFEHRAGGRAPNFGIKTPPPAAASRGRRRRLKDVGV